MKRLLISALLLLPLGARAQVTIDADFFTRGEVRRGGISKSSEDVDKDYGFDRANFIVERTKLSLDYAADNIQGRLTAQHSGTWGSKEGGDFNVHEAWMKFISDKGFFAQIGRQNLSYDDQRIFGSDDWSMTGITHDVLKLGFEGHGHSLHIFAGYNQNPENISGGTFYSGGLQPYKALEAAWYHLDIPRTSLGLSLLFADIGMQSGEKGSTDEYTLPRVRRQQVYGTFVTWKPGRLAAEAAYYRQGGVEEHGLPIDAWMASGKLSYSPSMHLTLYGGYDHLSGDDQYATPPMGQIGMIQHDKARGFSSVYGSHHKFYGAMDFFYVTTYYGGFTPGLQNAYGGITWKPGNKTSLDLAYHFLATATQLQNADKPLGHELEFSGSYSFRSNIKMSIGYSYMHGTETMVVLKRSTDNRQLRWAWLMLTVTPTIFSSR